MILRISVSFTGLGMTISRRMSWMEQ